MQNFKSIQGSFIPIYGVRAHPLWGAKETTYQLSEIRKTSISEFIQVFPTTNEKQTCITKHEIWPFNKNVTVEGEGGVHEIPDKPLRTSRGRGVRTFTFCKRKNLKFLLSSHRNFNIIFVYSFKIASKYHIVIAVVISCTYNAIIIAYTYICLLSKVRRATFRFKVSHNLTEIVT